MRILITGFPGTGKSAVAQELKKRGYYAYDPESMRGYMHLQDQQTGRHIQMPENLERGWYDSIGAFNWDLVRISHLIDTTQNDIFICSLAHNQDELLSQFDKMFVLTLDPLLLENRLKARNDDYLDRPGFIADTLTLYGTFVSRLVDQGAIPINVEPAVKDVVSAILTRTFNAA